MQKWLKYKNEHHYSVLATFSGLGGSGWKLSGLSWGILARSWVILGDLGVKLGPCWQHVGGKMAKKSEDMRTCIEIGENRKKSENRKVLLCKSENRIKNDAF